MLSTEYKFFTNVEGHSIGVKFKIDESQKASTLTLQGLDFMRFSLDDGRVVVYSPVTRKSCVLSATALQILTNVGRYRGIESLGSHESVGFSKLSQNEQNATRELESLLNCGFFASRDAVLDSLKTCLANSSPPGRITTIGIPTRNRSASLERAARSYLTAADRFGWSIRIIVVDDSETEADRLRNFKVLRSLHKVSGIDIFYSGIIERRKLASAISRWAGLAPRIVNFGIVPSSGFPCTVGSARNALLLNTVGELLISVDDDTICRIASVPECKEGLALTSRFDASEYWLFPSERSLMQSATFIDDDFLHLHESVLGRSLAEIIADFGRNGRIDLADVNSSFLVRARSGSGIVSVSSLGVAGDSGIGPPSWNLFLEGSSHRRLTTSKSVYKSLLTTRYALSGVSSTSVSEGTGCMALNLGIDNRKLVPPFMPVMKGEDAVFANLMKKHLHGRYFGLIPRCLLHLPPEIRKNSIDSIWDEMEGLVSNQILTALVASMSGAPNQRDEATRLQRLGSQLVDISAMAAEDFREFITITVWQTLTQHMLHLTRQFPVKNPRYWARDFEKAMAIRRDSLSNAQTIIPRDLLISHGRDKALTVFQELVGDFGRLLEAWPQIIEAAHSLSFRENPVLRKIL